MDQVPIAFQNALGQPLIKGLTEVASKRPPDPVKYLANYLYTYEDDPSNQINGQPKVLEQTFTVGEDHQLTAPPPLPVEAMVREDGAEHEEDGEEGQVRRTPEPLPTAFKPTQRINRSQRNLRRRKYLSSHAQEGPSPVVRSGTSISTFLFYQLCGSRLARAILLKLQLVPLLYGACVLMLAAKWQWPGQGIEQAGECRIVVGIMGEGDITAAEGYLPHPA
ncbi:hypothetical protein J6590_003708 [Homalodisca vitripennis]|nr:hypothetical protein J6590_003708 [Homalodisca vitripennis]